MERGSAVERRALGILGGGQLARMTALAAYELGLEVAILEAEPGSPAGLLATHEIVGSPGDAEARARLAAVAPVATLENEFVPPEALSALAALGVTVLPSAETIRLARDKLDQKRLLQAHGLPVTPFALVDSAAALRAFGERHGWPVVLKARRLGYDGRGNVTVAGPGEVEAAMAALLSGRRGGAAAYAPAGGDGDGPPLYAEAWVPFERELAVMAVRGRDGTLDAYPVVDTVQREHICHQVVAPSSIPEAEALRARELALRAAEAIGHVGVLGVELFRTAEGTILVNELAPRPHNSGHYTIEGCATSQFENHVRAVLGWPLGSTALRRPAAMVNLLGARSSAGEGAVAPSGLDAALALPDVHVHVYGKRVVRPGRKLGHVTALAPTPAAALELARRAAELIRF